MILDIETTGLSPKYNEAILVGIIYFRDNCWHLTQLFCDNRNEEKEMLLALKEYIHDELLITYNGYAFDIPFLNKRYIHHDINFQISEYKHFDLYRVVRASKKALNLPNYKLKTIEEFLGIYREDQISGKESVDLYNQYELNPSSELRHTILLHNSDDIEYMLPTMKILNYIPEDITSRYYPFVFYNDKYAEIVCHDYNIEKEYATAKFSTKYDSTPIMDIFNDYTITVVNGEISIKLPTFIIEDRTFIDIDLLDFLGINFNDLEYEEQLYFELVDKKSTLNIMNEILERHQ